MRIDVWRGHKVVMETQVEGYPIKRGKVRDIYDLGDRLVLVATDRISAFDVVMPNGIPYKGIILTQISNFWFERFSDIANHIIASDISALPSEFSSQAEIFSGRSVLVRKLDVIPIECVVRGYLAGSGWKEYVQTGSVCGVKLPAGLRQSDRLPEPIFTPATKATVGHDENISFQRAAEIVGRDLVEKLCSLSIELYKRASEYALECGIILADTKFEWAKDKEGRLYLVDEILTPDSSRFWPADEYEPGKEQPSFDKQFVRDYLEGIKWNKTPPAPVLPDDVVEGTMKRYIEAYERLTKRKFSY